MLPKIDVPIFTIKLVSGDKPVRFRPFTVKEEKLFLMANQSDDPKSMLETTKQILNNCVLDEIDIDEMPVFDIDYLFLNLRARSVGEIVKLKYKCNNIVSSADEEEKRCGHNVEYEVNLLEVVPKFGEGHTNKIEITENVGFVMKYPTIGLFEKFNGSETLENVLDITSKCIELVYDKENVYYAKDVTEKELSDFIDDLQTKDLEKVKKFFETLPKIQKELNFKCTKCKYEENIMVEGLESFFV